MSGEYQSKQKIAGDSKKVISNLSPLLLLLLPLFPVSPLETAATAASTVAACYSNIRLETRESDAFLSLSVADALVNLINRREMRPGAARELVVRVLCPFARER